MRTTPESERSEIERSTADLAEARERRKDPKPTPLRASALAASEETRRATLAFVAGRAADHDEHEDLHPPRLDAPAAALDRALADAALEKKNAAREARDA